MKTADKTSAGIHRTLFLLVILASFSLPLPAVAADPGKEDKKDQTIMLALLLDTSNSMDGLIDQAKSQLWKIVNELSSAKCDDGNRPQIRIALYEYGNDRLPASEGYIRQVSPLTDDLDEISERLFGLRTNGGNEFCGHVIRTALRQLDWSSSKSDLKMIFIAGNEPFTQGEVPYRAACELALEKDVVVNTIFCGDYEEGVRTAWKRGADITGGSYMSIEHSRRTVFVPTPYDDDIDRCNDRLNDTYIYYGRSGALKKEMQLSQDRNAESISESNKAERAISKSSHAYKNSSWDLVDAVKDNEKVIAETGEEHLPEEMRSMTIEQRKAYVMQKAGERKKIQEEIQKLSAKRQKYIEEHSHTGESAAMLDDVMLKAVRKQAKVKNLSW